LKAISRYANCDSKSAKEFQLAVREHVKPYVNISWMTWGTEIVPQNTKRAYANKMQELSCVAPQIFHYYAKDEIDDHVDMIIYALLKEYFSQWGLFACASNV